MKKSILLFSLSLAVGCSSMTVSSDLSERVSRAITREAKLEKHELDIQSWHNGVTIDGYVSSQSDKDQVERIARNVAGVENVDSRLEVRSTLTNASVNGQDRELVAAVTSALQRYARASDHNIDVIAVNGRVKLEGQVGSERDRAEIVRLVRQVNGVQSIDDNLSLRAALPDSAIQESVHQALQHTEGIDMAGLKFDTRNGIVTVSGAVRNHRDIDRVLGVILMVKGVRDARSDVSINAG